MIPCVKDFEDHPISKCTLLAAVVTIYFLDMNIWYTWACAT